MREREQAIEIEKKRRKKHPELSWTKCWLSWSSKQSRLLSQFQAEQGKPSEMERIEGMSKRANERERKKRARNENSRREKFRKQPERIPKKLLSNTDSKRKKQSVRWLYIKLWKQMVKMAMEMEVTKSGWDGGRRRRRHTSNDEIPF